MQTSVGVRRNQASVSTGSATNRTMGRSLQPQSEDPPEDVKKSTYKMLRSLLIITQTMPKLPERCRFNILVVRYDDVTPTEYQPKYFKSGTLDFKFPLESRTLKLGSVTSKYHSLALAIKPAFSGASASEDDKEEFIWKPPRAKKNKRFQEQSGR